MSLHFELRSGGASGPRRGLLHTPHGPVHTPAFMPVATRGTMRGVTHDRLRPMGAQMLLCNAWHLAMRPGVESVAALGGVHGMLAWEGPVLTDSGGFQVFSLDSLCRLHPDGVLVRDPIHGQEVDWTPARAFQAQVALGPDVAMVLDHCPSEPTRKDEVAPAVATTLRWAAIQRDLHEARGGAASGQALFGIVQGGVFPELREACARGLVAMDFDGYAVGGVSVGEAHEAMMRGIEASTPHLPPERIRYLMGVGTPLDLVEAVARGIDLFDCVFPTRTGRFATALTHEGRLHLLNARFREDRSPIEPGCDCDACRGGVPRGALRAGFQARELNPPILVAIHNLHFILRLMDRIRTALDQGGFETLRAEIRAHYPPRTDAGGKGNPLKPASPEPRSR